MNKAILTLLAIGFIATACYASDGSVQNVDRGQGTYQVGSVKRGSISDFNSAIPMSKNALKQGSDYNKQIPKIEKPKWNGN